MSILCDMLILIMWPSELKPVYVKYKTLTVDHNSVNIPVLSFKLCSNMCHINEPFGFIELRVTLLVSSINLNPFI